MSCDIVGFRDQKRGNEKQIGSEQVISTVWHDFAFSRFYFKNGDFISKTGNSYQKRGFYIKNGEPEGGHDETKEH